MGIQLDVIDKITGRLVAKYESETFFAFHEVGETRPLKSILTILCALAHSIQINAFEDPKTNSIVIDLPVMRDYSFLQAATIENLRSNIGRTNASAKFDIPGIFHRYRLPNHNDSTHLGNGTIVTRPAVLEFELPHKEANIELPRINPKYYGKDYQYA
jgi:torulene dioxygenase